MPIIIGSLALPLVKGQATNSTTANFAVADTRPTIVKPEASATRSVIGVLQAGNVRDLVTLKVTPYGGDANNDIINIKVIGWNSIQSPTGLPAIEYISRHVCEVQGTLSSALLGIALMPVVATEFFCDTLTLTTGIAVLHQGTADVDVAWFECDVSSYEWVEVLYSKGAGGDQMNCLYNW